MTRDMSWVEVEFLNSAVDVLRSSRRCLMFSYVFAFYLKKTNSAEIFEDNQVRFLIFLLSNDNEG